MNPQFPLSEKKEPQNESSSSLSVSVNKAFWIVFAAFDSFPLCSDLFGDHEAVTYLFIYLFLAADPRPPRSLVRPLLCSPDAASQMDDMHNARLNFIYLTRTHRNASKQFQGQVNLLDLQSGLDFTFYQHLSVYIYLPLLLTGLNLKFQGPQNSLGEAGWFICILFYCWV